MRLFFATIDVFPSKQERQAVMWSLILAQGAKTPILQARVDSAISDDTGNQKAKLIDYVSEFQSSYTLLTSLINL